MILFTYLKESETVSEHEWLRGGGEAGSPLNRETDAGLDPGTSGS